MMPRAILETLKELFEFMWANEIWWMAPIFNTPADAYHTYMASEMDALVVGNFFMTK